MANPIFYIILCRNSMNKTKAIENYINYLPIYKYIFTIITFIYFMINIHREFLGRNNGSIII